MTNSPWKRLGFLLLRLAMLSAFVSGSTSGQEPPSPPVKQTGPPVVNKRPNAVRRYGQVSFEVPRSLEVTVDNRSTGRITVTGWDRDVVSARAFSERGDEVVILDKTGDGPELNLYLKADYADVGSADPSAKALDMPPIGVDGPLQIHLEVNLPRYAVMQFIRVFRSNVQITNIDTPINILGEQSSIVLKQVGPVEVHTRSGGVQVEDAKGLIEVTTTTGAIHIANAKGGVRAVSIAGPIEVKCAQGRVDVSNTSAPIDLYNVTGDVEAIAASSPVRFLGGLGQSGRYYLRSMSGKVEVSLPANTIGFNASLSTYYGTVESEFPLKSTQPKGTVKTNNSSDEEIRRRLNGQFGKGGPQIILDSFEGLVRLARTTAPIDTSCK